MERAAIYIENAPVIGFPGWENALKERNFLDMVAHYRIREARWCIHHGAATEYEAFLYLYTASLAIPFSHEWCKIYIYLFNKFYGHLLNDKKDVEVVGGRKWWDIKEKDLSDYEKHLLNDLRSWLFKKQMRALKSILSKSGKQKDNRGKNKDNNKCRRKKERGQEKQEKQTLLAQFLVTQ